MSGRKPGRKPRGEAIVEALQAAYTQLKDIRNGWPEKELFEPPEKTLERIKSVAHNYLGAKIED